MKDAPSSSCEEQSMGRFEIQIIDGPVRGQPSSSCNTPAMGIRPRLVMMYAPVHMGRGACAVVLAAKG